MSDVGGLFQGLAEGYIQGQKMATMRKELAQREKQQEALNEWRKNQLQLRQQQLTQQRMQAMRQEHLRAEELEATKDYRQGVLDVQEKELGFREEKWEEQRQLREDEITAAQEANRIQIAKDAAELGMDKARLLFDVREDLQKQITEVMASPDMTAGDAEAMLGSVLESYKDQLLSLGFDRDQVKKQLIFSQGLINRLAAQKRKANAPGPGARFASWVASLVGDAVSGVLGRLSGDKVSDQSLSDLITGEGGGTESVDYGDQSTATTSAAPTTTSGSPLADEEAFNRWVNETPQGQQWVQDFASGKFGDPESDEAATKAFEAVDQYVQGGGK